MPGNAPAPPRLPQRAPYSVTAIVTPAAGSSIVTLPLPSSGGYSGQASLPVPSAPANLRITVTYANRLPAGLATLAALHAQGMPRRSPLDASDTDVVYACFSANQTVRLSAPPTYVFVLPPGFAPNGTAYYLALWQAAWVDGYGGPGTIVDRAASTAVAISGRFGFTIPAAGSVCVALYGRSTAAPAPAPAPAPTSSDAPAVTPTATPTAGPAMLSVEPQTVAVAGIGSLDARLLVVAETGYGRAFTEHDTCAGIATVVPQVSFGPSANVTVTGLKSGNCTATFVDGSGQTESTSVSVTTGSFTIQDGGRSR